MQIQHHKGAAAILVSQHFGVPPKLGMGKAQGQPPTPPPTSGSVFCIEGEIWRREEEKG